MNIKELLKDSYKEGMTSEELFKLLEDVDVVSANDYEKLKASLSKSNSEASANKKAKAEADSTVESLKAEIEALKKERNVANYKTQFVSLGYTDELADETAKALAEGDFNVVFNSHKKALEEMEKKLKAESMKNTPKPGAGGVPEQTITKEQFAKMGYAERVALYEKNPELYASLKK